MIEFVSNEKKSHKRKKQMSPWSPPCHSITHAEISLLTSLLLITIIILIVISSSSWTSNRNRKKLRVCLYIWNVNKIIGSIQIVWEVDFFSTSWMLWMMCFCWTLTWDGEVQHALFNCRFSLSESCWWPLNLCACLFSKHFNKSY